MRKLKLTPEEMKGLQTEARFLKLARSLRCELPWIRRVRKSGPIDDRNGIDFIIYATPTGPGKVIKIPVQIKSSFGGVVHFEVNHPDIALIIPVFSLAGNLSDRAALTLLRLKLTEQRNRGNDFVSLFTKKRPRPKDRQATTKTRGSVRKKNDLKRYLEREIRVEIRDELQ